MSNISLDINGLYKAYKKNIIFTDANMNVKGGDCIALVGENGCGKSTLINIIANIIKLDKGTITFKIDDEEIPMNKAWEYVSYVPQHNSLIDTLSAYDNLLFWYQGDRKKLNQDIKEGFIKELGIDQYINKRVNRMSGGMQKRVSIACALANNPRILLLDEANASLDIVCKLQIQKMLQKYAAMGNIVIHSTHEEGDIGVCNKIFYIADQKITEVPVTSLKDIFKDKL